MNKKQRTINIPINEYEDYRRKKEQLLKVKVFIGEAMRCLTQIKNKKLSIGKVIDNIQDDLL